MWYCWYSPGRMTPFSESYTNCEIGPENRTQNNITITMKFLSEGPAFPIPQPWDTGFKARIIACEELSQDHIFLLSYLPTRLSHFSFSAGIERVRGQNEMKVMMGKRDQVEKCPPSS